MLLVQSKENHWPFQIWLQCSRSCLFFIIWHLRNLWGGIRIVVQIFFCPIIVSFKSSIKSLLYRSLLRSSSRKWVLTYSWAIRDNSPFSIAVLSALGDQQLPPLCTLKIVPFLLPVTAVWFFGWLPWMTPHLNPASRCLWQSQAKFIYG